MIAQPPWYRWLESKLEPSWPIMAGLSAAIIALLVLLLMKGQAVPLAAFLTYLLMP